MPLFQKYTCNIRNFALVLTVLLLSACIRKSIDSKPKESLYSRRYSQSAQVVFEKAVEVITKNFNFQTQFMDPEKFIWISKAKRSMHVAGPGKYHLNVSVIDDSEANVRILRITKQEQIYYNNKWHNKISNNKLETEIFEALKR